MSDLINRVREARHASRVLARLDSKTKNEALQAIIRGLEANADRIMEANEADLLQAEEDHLASALLSRLTFDRSKIEASVTGLQSLIVLDDPVGKVLMGTRLDEGLDLYRVASPLGVVGVIFESRPDALVQIACLALKSGNAALLKGGSEAARTNRVLADVMLESTQGILPASWIILIEDRSEVTELLALDRYIDLLIPRGSNEFVRYIMDNTRIPVLGHADGICHTYVAADCDPDLAEKLVLDAKTEYTAVCNATETLLIDRAWPQAYRSRLIEALKRAGVTLYGDDLLAAEYDLAVAPNWRTEYLDMSLSVKLVDSVTDAIEHINEYGSGHTDAILTSDMALADRFMDEVDSANVFRNASTRFSDGFRYGFGAEVGVSTSKIHARGPVGLEGLLSYKYKLYGSGQIAGDYNSGRKKFLHDKITTEGL